ncbi:hypothetical protein GGI19_003690 [Coemansia pectinata]|uniref:Fungal-type protein kinase domain-containing protein n=1 Tax=Coemansia pectinata TaxID=1052879 RepID=A0A9W8GX75_9FUNG|nr:hypothetical protein GGI19_003690 [Coemansia pectinata]
MTVLPTEEETGLSSSQTMVDGGSGCPVLAGEDLSFSDISGNRDDDLDDLMQRILRRNCASVCKLASSRASDLRTVVGKIVSEVAADLEARMLMAAWDKGRANDPPSKGRANDPLSAWAAEILEWTGSQSLLSTTGSRYSNDSASRPLAADYVTPFFESFMLFVAHHVKAHFSEQAATGLLKPEDCRLILPVVNKDMEAERTDSYSSDYVNPADFVSVECGMFPLSCSVERQATPAPHLIVADVEIVGHPDDFNKAELRLATKTKALFFNQHNRRFAWGLTAFSCTIHAYVFGTDGIWASTAMDVSSAKGRRAFISLLVDWSLCSVDRLGFDPSIRYVVDGSVGGPYLEIDVHEMDESTGKVELHMYYSQQCVGAADRLTGRRARYFAASTSRKSMNTPAFLIKDMWTASGSGSAGDTRESSFLNVLHAEFDKSSEFSGSFSRLVSAGPVYISRGNTLVADSTAMAFSRLPSTTQGATKGSGDIKGSSSSNAQRSSNSYVRQHRRTVTKWPGYMISAADNPSQVIIAVADAMAALSAAYAKCKLLHGNISDQAILLQKMVGGIKGVLADFDYASYAGDDADAVPELMLFQSIRSLEDPKSIRTLLDDCESLLYLVCWLGTFGINQAQRAAYAARHAAGLEPYLPIMAWNQGAATDIANAKRTHMDTSRSFTRDILNRMHDNDGPLRHLAEDIHRALFLHPDCYGADTIPNPISDQALREVNMPEALCEALQTGCTRDPLVLRNDNDNVVAILVNLFDVLARHRDVALATLGAAAANTAGGAEEGAGA